MKKILSLLLVGLLSIGLFAGCAQKIESKKEGPTVIDQQPEEKVVSDSVEQPEEKESEINMEDFIINGQLQAPDSIGVVYYSATLTNNSKYAIKYADFEYNATIDGVYNSTYLCFSDTIMPGETSPSSECFGSDDMQLVKCSLTLKDLETGEEIFIDYDCKLKEITVY